MGNEKYTCPVCKREHDLPDGVTAGKQIAKDILKLYSEIQNKTSLPCPRCGMVQLEEKPTRNALSRSYDIIVCDKYGTIEAINVANNTELPLSEWYAVKELLNTFK